ncbi:MAG: aldehyde dehydrogenase family protein, partial [Rhizobiales bacterium]|nr:aldehyde dehydrogenase family protein [Hyphomicrobiales bacterium]
MPNLISHFIGGGLVAGQSGRTSPVYNPATGEAIRAVRLGGAAEVKAAVAAAKAAAPGWAGTTPLRRA